MSRAPRRAWAAGGAAALALLLAAPTPGQGPSPVTSGVGLAAPVSPAGLRLPGRSSSRAAASATSAPALEGAPEGAPPEMADRSRVGAEGFWRGFALQPRIRLGGVARGLRGLWDGPEVSPPLNLRTGERTWDPEARTQLLLSNGMDRMDEDHLATTWENQGVAYFHELPETDEGRHYLLHRFLYLFFLGRTPWGQVLEPHAVWVEVRERLDPSPAELEVLRGRVRSTLRAQRDELRDADRAELAPAQVEELEESLARLEGLLSAEELPLPRHTFVEEVVVADPVPIEGEPRFTLRRYRPEELEFYGDRVELWVTEGNHRFVPGPAHMTWTEECDAPWFFEPRGGRLPLVDLRFYRQRENPLAARARGEEVPAMPGFVDTPVMLHGFRAAARLYPGLFESAPWSDES